MCTVAAICNLYGLSVVCLIKLLLFIYIFVFIGCKLYYLYECPVIRGTMQQIEPLVQCSGNQNIDVDAFCFQGTEVKNKNKKMPFKSFFRSKNHKNV